MEVFNLVHTVSCFLLYGLNRYGKSVHNYVRNYYNWSNSKTFEADSKNESEVIVNSLPILKTNCVCEIYSSNYYSFISVTVGCFTMGMKNGVNLFEFIETTMVASISFILVYLSFVLPISFWLGYKKTIFITIVIFMAPIVVLEALFQINLEQIQLYNNVLFISSICMFIVSIFVSVKLYEKKEF